MLPDQVKSPEKKKDSGPAALGVKNANRSPFFSKKKMGGKASSEFNFLPLVVPGWLEQLPIPPGRRSRRTSEEQGPINMKSILRPFSPSKSNESWDDDGLPKIPTHEIFNPPKDQDNKGDSDDEPKQQFRGRASTIGNGQIPRLARAPLIQRGKSCKNSEISDKVHVVLRFNFANLQKSPSTVYVAGSMTDWKSVEMARCKGEKDFNLILDCSPGKYFYKFYVNNEWCIDDSQPISTYTMPKKSSSTKGAKLVKANVIKVKQEDKEVFEALACDSFAVKSLEKKTNYTWGQQKPKFDSNQGTGGPPILPPQLLNILLNKENSERTDPVLLPEPSTHVMLNHLYAQSIRENLLVMATTTRYKKKCVTIVYYCPLDN